MKKYLYSIMLLAILIQAMIPTGFMPGKAFAGSFIEICSADGLIIVELDQNGQPVKEHGKKKPCAFSLLPVVNVSAAIVVTPMILAELPKVISAYDIELNQNTIFLPPATAPPTLI